MREIHQYNDSLIAITDEVPLGFEDGTYIVSSLKRGWAILYSQGEMVVSGFEGFQCIPDKETALKAAKSLIDQHRKEMDSDAVAYREKRADEDRALLAELQETRLFHGTNITIPVDLLVALHNASPQGSSARNKVMEYIADSAKKPIGMSWTSGLRKMNSGDLYFSDAAYTTALYRAKQETRTRGVMELFSKLSRELDLVKVFHDHEMAAFSQVPEETGDPLVEVKDCSAQLIQLREKLTVLRSNINLPDGTAQITAELGLNNKS